MSFKDILEGHLRFKKKFVERETAFLKLAEEGQHPGVLWIGCSDSRVIPEQISAAAPGELFVMRNIANIIPPFEKTGGAVGAVIEYAMLHLKVRHAVICGHTQCGGIKALETPLDTDREPVIAKWLNLARPARKHAQSLGLEGDALYLETIKLNVLLQKKNLFTYSCVAERVDTRNLTIHCWLYDLFSGDILFFEDESQSWRVLVPR